VVSIHWQGSDHFPLKSWLQVTYPLLNAASFDTFCLVTPQPQEIQKDIQLHLTRTRLGFPTSHQPRFYAAPNFRKIGIKYPNLSSFIQSFDNTGRNVCCKVSLHKNSPRESCSAINCLLSGINILAGSSSVPLISEGKGTDPHWKHTSPHSAAAVTSLRH